ncbi:MAG: Smr/MutS family protein [Ancalomicrobiaceae bacterium]|nr:Smr/MutS family protein [Ancalomicrobiaceae bacterium]
MIGRRRRALSEEERLLWQKVAEGVEPLWHSRRRGTKPNDAAVEPPVAAEPDPPPSPVATAPVSPSAAPPRSVAPAKPAKPAPPALAHMDTKTKRRIARGALPLEERIDLHGLTQANAYSALRGFIAGARARGAKLVLVITGKGVGPSEDGDHHRFSVGERGVLRRLVPQWLALPDMREYVVGFEEAHVAHGGAGAIYVRLRSPRAGGRGRHGGTVL